ncbi:MAG TPA: 3-hydroxyacyl-CoA dehydrogenase NAD-binding domain-containing protein [Chloroflexota bacterium]|nr:3-hydroxyacyl-CoA dehydrogenase NAD-binding domain-containing protein [Chloroflexota bacterium]
MSTPAGTSVEHQRSRTVRRIAVVGTGFMGTGIGVELALRVSTLESVALCDAQEGAAARAVERAREIGRTLSDAGVISEDEANSRLGRLRAAPSLEEALDGVTYVVEAVPEELPIKQHTFSLLDRIALPDAVLASNTSGFDPAELAQGLTHPERILVAHYFGPAYLIPLVEIVPHSATASWAVERTETLLETAGKRPIRLGQFAPGFVANRLQQALFREALYLVREGIATPDAIDEVVRFSFGPRLASLGPFTVADFAGLDVYSSLATNVWPTLSTETAAEAPPRELAERVSSGSLGTKTGQGFHSWPPDRLQSIGARRDVALARVLQSTES